MEFNALECKNRPSHLSVSVRLERRLGLKVIEMDQLDRSSGDGDRQYGASFVLIICKARRSQCIYMEL